MVMRQGFTIVAAGLVVGALLAAAAAVALRGLLYGITPFDPIAWGFALTAMLGAAAMPAEATIESASSSVRYGQNS